jgi:hypothetical protein
MRAKQRQYLPQLLFLFCAAAMLAVSGMQSRGWAFRERGVSSMPSSAMYEKLCVEKTASNDYSRKCLVGRMADWGNAELPRARAVIIGSSFAEHLIPAFDVLARQRNESYLFYYKIGCPISAQNNNVLAWHAGTAKVEQSAQCQEQNAWRWEVVRTMMNRSSFVILSDEWYDAVGAEKAIRCAEDALRYGKRVVVAGPIPLNPKDRPSSFSTDWQWLPLGRLFRALGMEISFDETVTAGENQLRSRNRMHEYLRKHPGAFEYVNIYDRFCHGADADGGQAGLPRCRLHVTVDGQPRPMYMSDGYHLSYYGARELAPLFDRAISRLA